MTPGALTGSQSFSTKCRHWRQFRKLSQLELALAANVSQRHVSWLETGRSQPSREMVVRLSDAMAIPLRERNVLLQSAGYAAAYQERSLDEPTMTPVLPPELNINGLALSLFSVLSTFGTPQDITTDELRIEAFYPADHDPEHFLKASPRVVPAPPAAIGSRKN